MQINDKLLSKLEKLSALKIEKNKRTDAINELNKIVGFIEILNELDLTKETATFNTLKGGTPFREDITNLNSEIIDIILSKAPKREDKYFIVPKIL